MASPIEWPRWVRRGPNREGAATSPLHDERVAAWLGIALGLTFTVCFLTGLYSHWAQSGDPWIPFPSRPAGLYRVTQGLHVIAGFMSVPVLMAKLWVVVPRFFEAPRFRSIGRAIERISLFPLVGGGVFMVVSGVNNVAAWYPWSFFFTTVHHWVSWITMGALVTHVGAKWVVVRETVSARGGTERRSAVQPAGASLSRRGFLGTVGATSAVLGVAVGAQTVPVFEPFGLLAPRDLDDPRSPQGFPVNSSARRRGVVELARSPDYRLRVIGDVEEELDLTLADVRALPMHEAELPIACVEGWSKSARWTGVRVRDLLDLAGAGRGAEARIVSLQRGGLYRSSYLNRNHAADRDTLLALAINGEELHLDHGYPVRLIAPNRPGVWQTKWVTEVRVL
jgi:hypothetical protein